MIEQMDLVPKHPFTEALLNLGLELQTVDTARVTLKKAGRSPGFSEGFTFISLSKAALLFTVKVSHSLNVFLYVRTGGGDNKAMEYRAPSLGSNQT